MDPGTLIILATSVGALNFSSADFSNSLADVLLDAHFSAKHRVRTLEICGSRWESLFQGFVASHSAAVETARTGSDTVKMVVVEPNPSSGLADRLVAMVSAFVFSLEAGRLLLIDWPELFNVFELPSPSFAYDAKLFENPRMNRTIRHLDVLNCATLAACYGPKPNFYSEDILVFKGNRGPFHLLFGDGEPDLRLLYTTRLLQAIPERFFWQNKGFTCALRSLVRPKAVIFSSHGDMSRLLSDSAVFSVVWHVRFGDVAFANHDFKNQLPALQPHFSLSTQAACAGSLAHNATARVFVLSDSFEFAQYVKANWNLSCRGEVVTAMRRPMHISTTHTSESIHDAVGDWWLATLCSAFVLSGSPEQSGFKHTAFAYGARTGFLKRGDTVDVLNSYWPIASNWSGL